MLTLTIKTLEQIQDEQILEARDTSTPEKWAQWFWTALKADIREWRVTGSDPGRTHGGLPWTIEKGIEVENIIRTFPDFAEVCVEYAEVADHRLTDGWASEAFES